ncbi:MAG: hypothetical protein WC761_01155 [Candidatus Paceibacterota bacterium]|jgi:hypothetical protein
MTTTPKPVRIFRISMFYRGQTRVIKKTLYESQKSWACVLGNRKRNILASYHMRGSVNLVSEECVEGTWMLVDNWWNI